MGRQEKVKDLRGVKVDGVETQQGAVNDLEALTFLDGQVY
jgi:hypothetical protein